MASIAIPAGTALIGGYLNYKGQKDANEAASQPSKYAERARQEARQYIQPQHIYQMAQWLFPGALGKPPMGLIPSVSAPPQAQPQPQAGGAASGNTPGKLFLQWLAQGMQKKQDGGGVQANQPYLVGEKGPELVVPGQPGNVLPNPNTAAGGTAPAAGGAPVLTPTAPLGASGSDLGTLSVQAAHNFLANPGQMSTVQYERAQEQANQGLNANVQGIMGSLTGMGVSPRSGFAQNALQSAYNENTRTRAMAARDMAVQEEQLKRADIAAGLTAYQNFLNQVFGIVGTQAGTVGGGQFPSVPAINPYQNLSQAIATGGSLLGDYFEKKK